MLKMVIAAVVAVFVIALAVILILFNRKRLQIIRCAKAATSWQLEAIYAQIDRLGTEVPSCAILARTNRHSAVDEDWAIPVPPYVKPWQDRVISADGGSNVAFQFSAIEASEPILRGQIYRIVPVPRHLTKSGKARNQITPSKYVSSDPELRKALTAVCPAYPSELLSYLLAGGAETFEFDPMFQARIGGSPSWVQDAEYPRCEECKEQMSLILQIPGAMLPGKKLPEGTFFFFGCERHPVNTKTLAQFA